MGYVYVLLTVVLTAYGQLAIKWQVNLAGPMPNERSAQVAYFAALLLNPWVVSAIAAAFGAMLAWMAAMARFELSQIYPYTAGNFVLVGLGSVWLFGEALTAPKVIGVALICAGLIVMARG